MSNIERLSKPRPVGKYGDFHLKRMEHNARKMGAHTNTKTTINGIPEQVSQARRSYEKYPAIFTRMVGSAING